MLRSPAAAAQRERLHVGAGIARRQAYHERRAQERGARPAVTQRDLSLEGADVEWAPASSIVVADEGPNYRPAFRRVRKGERRGKRQRGDGAGGDDEALEDEEGAEEEGAGFDGGDAAVEVADRQVVALAAPSGATPAATSAVRVRTSALSEAFDARLQRRRMERRCRR